MDRHDRRVHCRPEFPRWYALQGQFVAKMSVSTANGQFEIVGAARDGNFNVWGPMTATYLRFLRNQDAALIAAIPCIGPCCILGIPVGIWAFVVLNRPHIRDAFDTI